jgi:hypothetical protein
MEAEHFGKNQSSVNYPYSLSSSGETTIPDKDKIR